MNRLQLESVVKFILGITLVVLAFAIGLPDPAQAIGIVLMVIGGVEFPFRFF